MRQVAVIGLGRFGRAVARTLTNKGAEVLAIDEDKDQVEEIKDYVALAVCLDTTDEKALRAVGLDNVDVAIVCMGKDIEANLLTTTLLKKMGVKNIYSRASSKIQEEILKSIEVSRVINLEEEMGVTVANSVVQTNIEKHVELSTGHSLAEVKLSKKFLGKTIKQVDPRKNYKVNIIAIKKEVPEVDEQGERLSRHVINDLPQPDDVFEEGDILVVVGEDENIEAFSKK